MLTKRVYDPHQGGCKGHVLLFSGKEEEKIVYTTSKIINAGRTLYNLEKSRIKQIENSSILKLFDGRPSKANSARLALLDKTLNSIDPKASKQDAFITLYLFYMKHPAFPGLRNELASMVGVPIPALIVGPHGGNAGVQIDAINKFEKLVKSIAEEYGIYPGSKDIPMMRLSSKASE